MSFGTVSGLDSPCPFCLLETARGRAEVTEFLNRKVTVATVELNQASHLSRLLFLGICFPARAHNSPSDGCLNLKRLRKPTGWGIRKNRMFYTSFHGKEVHLLPAVTQEPAREGEMWGHSLHYADRQQAHHQLNPHQSLKR